MTGNDIVDIATAAAESNPERKGFLEKIFTLQEQRCIREAECPHQMVWRIWSMKESAYKIHTRQYGGRSFAPLKFHCSIVSRSEGVVNTCHTAYHTSTYVTTKYIYSIAGTDELCRNSFMNSCFRITDTPPNKQRQYIYERMISLYALVSGKEKSEMEVMKDGNGIPFLYCRQDERIIPVSITHHGHYAAFTIDK